MVYTPLESLSKGMSNFFTYGLFCSASSHMTKQLMDTCNSPCGFVLKKELRS